MHVGNIKGYTAPGRVYAYMSARLGEWCDPYEMQDVCRTTALSTRISEVRAQLDERYERVETKQVGRHWFYRLVAGGEQLELAV